MIAIMPAVVDEVACQRAAEVHANLCARIWTGSRPVRDLNHIQKLPICDGRAVLVNVEFVIFQRAVLNRPVFDRSLRCNDGWRIVRAEQRSGLTISGG
jgi:hypothetical protein